jgi:hypothetical protein
MKIESSLDKERAINKIKSLNLDKPWSVDIKPYKKNRSLAQNKLYFMWMKIIGDEIGYTSEEIHAIMADRFLTTEFVEYGGNKIKRDKSTSKLNTKEFTEYLESIDRWAAGEMGIVLPSPEDLIFEAMGIRR